MNLGIDITLDSIRFSVRSSTDFTDTQICGYDPAGCRTMSDPQTEIFISECRKAVQTLLHDETPQIVLATVPLTFGYTERLHLRLLFQAAGIRINRFISRGGAKGIYIRSLLVWEEDHVCCCVGQNGGWLECCYFFAHDVIVPEVNLTCKLSDFCTNPELQKSYSNVCLKGNDREMHPAERIWFSDHLDTNAEHFAALTSMKECRKADEYAASRGACLYAEVLEGTNTELLLLDIVPEELGLSVNGGEWLPIIPYSPMSSTVVPVIKRLEVTPHLPCGNAEIAVLLRNPYTAAATKLTSFHTFLPSADSRAEITAKIDTSANIELSIHIDGMETLKVNSRCV